MAIIHFYNKPNYPIIHLHLIISNTRRKNRKPIVYENEFHGILDNVYRDHKNHNTLTVCSNKNCYTIPAVWESYFEIGDSISKNKNSFILEVYNTHKNLQMLNYEDLRH